MKSTCNSISENESTGLRLSCQSINCMIKPLHTVCTRKIISFLLVAFLFFSDSCHNFAEIDKMNYRKDRASRHIPKENTIPFFNLTLNNFSKDSIIPRSNDTVGIFSAVKSLHENIIDKHPSLLSDTNRSKKGKAKWHPASKKNDEPLTPQEEVNEDFRKGKLYLALGILFPLLLFPMSIFFLFEARNKMKEYGIVDEQLKQKINFCIFLTIVFAIGFGAFYIYLMIMLVQGFLFLMGVMSEVCYIATMVYGDYDAPEVLVLRKFRDEKLKPHFAGRIFIAVYYALSPYFVKFFRNNKSVNRSCKYLLDKFVARLRREFAEEQIILN